MIELKLNKKLISAEGNMVLDVELKIERNSFTAITGASGTGKTTLLRCIAGLAEPDAGYISCGDNIWYDSSRKILIPVRKRSIGFVFQDYALFPNMTFRENIIYACGDKKKADEFIYMADLNGVSNLYPEKLSSGQMQRCALLRAVSRGPELLLLDEPFAALDGETKKYFYNELSKWRDVFGLTIIMVSHDRAEVVRLAERVIQLKRGIIESDVSHKSNCFGRIAAIQAAARRVS
jgi:molybdate transport system ATP-binding protein